MGRFQPSAISPQPVLFIVKPGEVSKVTIAYILKIDPNPQSGSEQRKQSPHRGGRIGRTEQFQLRLCSVPVAGMLLRGPITAGGKSDSRLSSFSSLCRRRAIGPVIAPSRHMAASIQSNKHPAPRKRRTYEVQAYSPVQLGAGNNIYHSPLTILHPLLLISAIQHSQAA